MFQRLQIFLGALAYTLCAMALLLDLNLQTSAQANAQSTFLDMVSTNQAVVTTSHVRAELVAYAPQGIQPGQNIWLGLKIEHQPNWHTYWKNPGDTGLPTTLQWHLPAGLAAGEIQWPVPQRLPIENIIVNYGYDGTILLPVPVTVAPDFQADPLQPLHISLRADWLACHIECVPEGGDFVLSLPAQQSTVSEIGLFETTLQALPQPQQGIEAQVQVNDASGSLTWRIQGLPQAAQGQGVHLFPENPDIIANTGAMQSGWEGDTWTATYALSDNRTQTPSQLSAVLVLSESNGGAAPSPANQPKQAIQLVAPVGGQWPALRTISIPPALQAGIDADRNASQLAGLSAGGQTQGTLPLPSSSGISFAGALLLALLGGLLLNLMPCVFPVLSIKALTFAQSGAHTRSMHVVTGLAYGLGVILTMLLLAGIMLALRAGGAGLGWGFQLQSPVFVAMLAALFVLIGMNLMGVFEVRLFLPAGLCGLKGKTPVFDAFFSGIVSVLIATPCTAPFMGAALGVALILPAWQALLIFLMLGVGLALPLVLVACLPALVKWLPRPGAWMVTFRQLMAFPMLATVLWLVWVVGLQAGVNGAVALLAILLMLAFFVWVVGWAQHAPQKKTGANQVAPVLRSVLLAASFGLFVISLVWLGPVLRQTHAPQHSAVSSSPMQAAAWQPWSSERVRQLQAQNKPVFIDFTAAWCVTCQFNKQTTLMQPQVLQAFADKDVVLLEADWTRHDPLIAQELQRLGRSGLPVYVLLWPGRDPQLLPEVLTPGIVLDALNSAANQQ